MLNDKEEGKTIEQKLVGKDFAALNERPLLRAEVLELMVMRIFAVFPCNDSFSKKAVSHLIYSDGRNTIPWVWCLPMFTLYSMPGLNELTDFTSATTVLLAITYCFIP
jgi:hypothetical protein